MNKTHTNQSGFTLIECLVALLIIAIVLASATRSIGLAVDDVHDAYAREAANWVADNQYNQYYLDSVYPDLGNDTKNVTMAGIDFNVETVVSATPNQYFRRLEIAVSEKKKPKYVLFRNVNFIAQY
jgi:general secretion pathway protein I